MQAPQAYINTLKYKPGHQGPSEPLRLAIPHACCHPWLPVELAVPSRPQGREGKPGTCVVWTSPRVPFTFANFNLYPLAIINYNHK